MKMYNNAENENQLGMASQRRQELQLSAGAGVDLS